MCLYCKKTRSVIPALSAFSTSNDNPENSGHDIREAKNRFKKNNLVKASFANVSSAKLCTTLENDHGVKVGSAVSFPKWLQDLPIFDGMNQSVPAAFITSDL